MVYCSHCGKELTEPIPLYCPFCGKENIVRQAPQLVVVPATLKDPEISAILGFIIPGLGHVYLGDLRMAIILFIVAVVMTKAAGFWGLLICIISAWKAYNDAKEFNESITNRARA